MSHERRRMLRRRDEQPSGVKINGVNFVVEYLDASKAFDTSWVRVRPEILSPETAETLDYEDGPTGVLAPRGGVTAIAEETDPQGLDDHTIAMARAVSKLVHEHFAAENNTHHFLAARYNPALGQLNVNADEEPSQECYVYNTELNAQVVKLAATNYLKELAKRHANSWPSQPAESEEVEAPPSGKFVTRAVTPKQKAPDPANTDISRALDEIGDILLTHFGADDQAGPRAKAAAALLTYHLRESGKLPPGPQEPGPGSPPPPA